MVYLVDWKSAQKYLKQITDIEWKFDHYGPYVSDVIETVSVDSQLQITEQSSAFGTPKFIISAVDDKMDLSYTSLTPVEESIIKEVILDTKDLYWNDFIEYVYETYPIVTQKRYSNLNLVELAIEERELK